MTRLLLLLPLLAACAASPEGTGPVGSGLVGTGVPIFGGAAPEPEAPPPLPANVQAALPPGAPASVVIPDGSGCYLLAIERTDPPSGFPLRDAAGNRVCDGGAPVVSVAPPVAPATAAPIGSTPRPGELPAAAPAADPAFPPAGGITPPAPIAPLV